MSPLLHSGSNGSGSLRHHRSSSWFAVSERVPLVDEPIMAALLSFNPSLVQSSRLSLIVGEVLEQQCHYHGFPLATHDEYCPFHRKSKCLDSLKRAISTRFILCHQSSVTLSVRSAFSNEDEHSCFLASLESHRVSLYL